MSKVPGSWPAAPSETRGRVARLSPGCTVYRPNIGGLLPLYVQDRYEGIEAKTFADCTDEEIARYIQANVEAVREIAELVRPEVALANHLVMGPVILARALGEQTPYAVKVHGSALEYTVKPEPERFMGFAREGLAGAKTVLVGSRHTAESLWRGAWRGGRGSGQATHPPWPSRGRCRALPPAGAARGLGGRCAGCSSVYSVALPLPLRSRRALSRATSSWLQMRSRRFWIGGACS